jgi:hypothetical protein
MDTENTVPEHKKTQWPQYVIYFLLIFFFTYAWLLALTPLGDADVWFHLKNGQYILDTHSLPGPGDPYGFTLDGVELSEGRLHGLQSQWLGQVILYLAFSLSGAKGVAILKATTLVLPFFLLMMLGVARGEGVSGLAVRLSVISFPLLFLAIFFPLSFERPQGFSFLFAFIILVILEGLEKKNSRMFWAYALPVTMFIWSNIHGGYVIGIFIIVLWALGNLVSLIAEKKGLSIARRLTPAIERPWRFFAACVTGVLAAGLHPGGFQQVNIAVSVLKIYFSSFLSGSPGSSGTAVSGGSSVLGQVLEYKPLAYFMTDLNMIWTVHVFAFLGISLLVILFTFFIQGRVKLPFLLVSVFVVWFGVVYFRGIFFALPVLAFCVTASLQPEALKGWKKIAPAVILLLILAAMLLQYGNKEPWRLKPQVPTNWVRGNFPAEAVRFMRAKNVSGPLFNYLGWGGYLIWSAWPDYKVFVDGREIDPKAFGKYVGILRGTSDWKEVLDSYGINAILVPALSEMTGAIFPILFRMGWNMDRDWTPVFTLNNAVLLVRNGSEANSGVIECCAMSHEQMNRYIADSAALMLIERPGDIVLHESRAAAFYFAGLEEKAGRVLLQLPDSNLKRALVDRISGRISGRNSGEMK